MGRLTPAFTELVSEAREKARAFRHGETGCDGVGGGCFGHSHAATVRLMT